MAKIKAYQLDIIPTNASKVIGTDPITNKIPIDLIPINQLPIIPKKYKRSCVIGGEVQSGNILSGNTYIKNDLPFYLGNISNSLFIKPNTKFIFSKNENDYFVSFSDQVFILDIPSTTHLSTTLYLYASLDNIENNEISYGYTLCPPTFSFANPELIGMIPPISSTNLQGFDFSGSSTSINNTSIYNLFNKQIFNFVEFTSNANVQVKFPTTSLKPIKIYSYSIKVSDSSFPNSWSFYGIRPDNSIILMHSVSGISFSTFEEKIFHITDNVNENLIGFKIVFNNSSNIKLIDLNVYGSETFCISIPTYTYFSFKPNNSWEEISSPRIYLGEIQTNSTGQINNIILYSYNGFSSTGWINVKSVDTILFTHNIGFPPINIKAIARIKTTNLNDINNSSFNSRLMDYHYFPIDLLPYNSGISVNYVTRTALELVCRNGKVLDLNNSFLYNTDIMILVDRGW